MPGAGILYSNDLHTIVSLIPQGTHGKCDRSVVIMNSEDTTEQYWNPNPASHKSNIAVSYSKMILNDSRKL